MTETQIVSERGSILRKASCSMILIGSVVVAIAFLLELIAEESLRREMERASVVPNPRV